MKSSLKNFPLIKDSSSEFPFLHVKPTRTPPKSSVRKMNTITDQRKEEKRREAECINDGRVPGCSKSFYGNVKMDAVNGVQHAQNDEEAIRKERPNDAPRETGRPLRGCERERTICEEMPTFVKWNSNFLTGVFAMIVLVVFCVAAYAIIYKDSCNVNLTPAKNKTCPPPQDAWAGAEIGTGGCNRMFDTITFPSHVADQLKMCVNKDEDEKIAMLLDATGEGSEELNLWEHWELDCAWAVNQLMLKGPFSYKTLVNFKSLFGKNTRKLVVSGPEICEISTDEEQVLDPIVFTGLSHITFFNMTENCDKLIEIFLRGAKLDTALVIEFNYIRVNEYIKKTVGKLLDKGKISAVLLYNLKFDIDDYLK